MMQERWPPEPPRFEPPPEHSPIHTVWLVLAALAVVAMTFALIWGAQQTFLTLPG